MSNTPNNLDRFLEAMRAIIRSELPNIRYLGTWEYTVLGVNTDGTCNLAATSPTAPLPNLGNVPMRSGSEGGVATPTPGNLCYVRFVNGDPTRPIVFGNQPIVKSSTFDATETVSVGESVSNAVVLADGSNPVARSGDTVTVYFGDPTGLPSTATISGVFTPSPAPPLPGIITGTMTLSGPPATGIITSGSPKVLA